MHAGRVRAKANRFGTPQVSDRKIHPTLMGIMETCAPMMGDKCSLSLALEKEN